MMLLKFSHKNTEVAYTRTNILAVTHKASLKIRDKTIFIQDLQTRKFHSSIIILDKQKSKFEKLEYNVKQKGENLNENANTETASVDQILEESIDLRTPAESFSTFGSETFKQDAKPSEENVSNETLPTDNMQNDALVNPFDFEDSMNGSSDLDSGIENNSSTKENPVEISIPSELDEDEIIDSFCEKLFELLAHLDLSCEKLALISFTGHLIKNCATAYSNYKKVVLTTPYVNRVPFALGINNRNIIVHTSRLPEDGFPNRNNRDKGKQRLPEINTDLTETVNKKSISTIMEEVDHLLVQRLSNPDLSIFDPNLSESELDSCLFQLYTELYTAIYNHMQGIEQEIPNIRSFFIYQVSNSLFYEGENLNNMSDSELINTFLENNIQLGSSEIQSNSIGGRVESEQIDPTLFVSDDEEQFQIYNPNNPI